MTIPNLIANYLQLKSEIDLLARKYGRNPADVHLIIVSKFQSLEHILQLYGAGQRLFGESRQQESESKIQQGPIDISWHFIGPLQKNKVRKVIGHVDLIHSVDTPELAKKISDVSLESGVITKILLEVNTTGEPTKHGLSIDAWKERLERVVNLPGIKIEGLMTMGPAELNESASRRCFSMLREFRDSLPIYLPQLSMGMSNDYPSAIAEGASLLRIGSKIFANPDS